MARVIVACPHCKARFDVSSFKPGSRIRCGSCYKILVIPDRRGGSPAPAPKKKEPPPRRRKASRLPPRRTAPEEKPPVRRAARRKKRAAPAVVKEKTPVEAGVQSAPAAPSKPADSMIGSRINGEFEIVGLLGQGGYGTVYEAVDLSLKRRVAVKLMLREKTTNKEFVSKFLREARTAAQLSHPNIVKIHLVGFSKDLQQHFLAMEYVEGDTLSDIMANEGVFSVDRAVDVVIQSANGLAAAHRKNIIHRDIKPGNIMITPKGVVKVADFGLAKIYDPDDAASMVIGTPYFMPPEQFEGKARDGRTDIYALGVTFYILLTLKRPFDGKTPAQVLLNVMQKEPAPPHELNPDISEKLSKIILKMIAKNLRDRYSTCEELLRDLKTCQEDHGEEAVFCPNCGFPNPFTAQRCSECPTSLLEPCPKCGTPDSIGAKFCGSCGANLAKERQVMAMLAEAQSHEAAGRLEKALGIYREAKDVAPENTRAVEGLRRAEQLQAERDDLVGSLSGMLDEGKFLEALPAAEEAVERFGDHKAFADILARAREGAKEDRLRVSLADVRALLDAGRLIEACDAARQGIEIDPQSEEARSILTETELAVEKHAEICDRAVALEESGSLRDAQGAWREALELLPSDEKAGQAVQRIEGVIAQVESLRVQAEEALETADLLRARRLLEDALSVLPSDGPTLEVLDRLREMEQSFAQAFGGGLELLHGGEFEQARSALEDLGARFPGSKVLAETGEKASALAEIASFFFQEARAQLVANHPDLASAFLELGRRITPSDPAAEALFGEIIEHKREDESILTRARTQVEGGEFDQAIENLATRGGVASPNPKVAELARSAIDGLRRKRPSSTDNRERLLRSALRTTRELLDAGRAHAALSACQKALRIDRKNPQARALKLEIDSTIQALEQPGGDSRIETGFFDIEGLGNRE